MTENPTIEAMWTNGVRAIQSTDANVAKYVFSKGNAVAEAVLYKYPTYQYRTVICCSTQSGCPVGCRFCGAGDYFVRSLTVEEIVSQPMYLLQQTGVDTADIERLQIMFMSMGEPMYNFDALAEAMGILYATVPHARLLISTSAPRKFEDFKKLNELSRQIPTIGLQFSVHESTDEARKALIPSATMTLEEIATTGVSWANASGRRPFFNYCVHPANDSQEDVDRLTTLFDPSIWEATISVICERDEHISAANQRQRDLAANFMQKMLKANFSTRMFDPAGQDDIGGGCGQLWFVQEWMRQHPEMAKKTQGFGKPVRHTPKVIDTLELVGA